MKTLYFLSFCIIIALTSCSSSQKTAQTSDDVYYSQGRQTTTSNASSNEFDYYNANSSDQYLAMRVQDPNRWSTFDDYDYGWAGAGGYSPYSYGASWIYYGGFGISPWLSYGLYPYYGYGFGYMNYYAWNCFHNPYYGGPGVIGNSYAMSGIYNQLHPYNVTSYGNTVINNSNLRNNRFSTPSSTTRNIVNNNLYRNGNSNNSFRRSNFNNQQNNSNFRQNNNFQSTRSFTPSTPSGGGFSGGGGGARGSFGHH